MWNLWRIPRPQRFILSNIWGHFSTDNPYLLFGFWSQDLCRSRNMRKLHLNMLNVFLLIKNGCLNCLKIAKMKDYEKKSNLIFFFDRNIHTQVGMIRRRLFLQQSEAQSTSLWRGRALPEMAARCRCVLLINNLTAHYNSQFCVSFHFCLFWSGITQMTISGSNLGLNIPMFVSKSQCLDFL